jgi:YspA, cpYpsA-related SLOG family
VKLLVTGGRNYKDHEAMDRALRKWISPGDRKSIIITGGATGADQLASLWGHHNGVHVAQVGALWDWNSNAAGPIRNAVMLDLLQPELVLAFPGGRGTANCILEAKRLGISVRNAVSETDGTV